MSVSLPLQIDRIAGESRSPVQSLGRWLCDPSTGEPLVEQAQTDLAAVDTALECAYRLHRAGTWAALSAEARAEHLERVVPVLEAAVERIAGIESLGSGVLLTVTRLFAESMAGSFRDAIALLRSATFQDLSNGSRPVELHRFAWGPTAVLVPWNAPAAMAAKKTAYALAAGAPVILKPPEWAPLGCNLLADAIASAELPVGAFQMVHGGARVGAMLCTDPRIRAISFTGSAATGRAIAANAAQDFKALQLELGGNNPVVVRHDAALDAAAASIAAGMTKLNGQWCEGPGMVFVPSSRYGDFVDALASQLAEVKLGSTWDATASMGPLANEPHRLLLQSEVGALAEQGATVHAFGDLPELGGWFWQPRVVTAASVETCTEELFGPVVTVHRVESDSEAVTTANDSPYGLAAYVYGEDVEAAMQVGRALRFGEVKINGSSIVDLSPRSAQSFWRGSGIGGHGNSDLFDFFSGVQIVGVDAPGMPI